MGFFDENDPFEDIVREFFGGTSPPSRGSRRRVSKDSDVISGEEDERTIDFIESKDNFFVVFELGGYDKSDVKLEMKGNKLIVTAHKKPTEKTQDYLSEKLSAGISITKILPDYIKSKNYNHTFVNGVLEVSFKK